MIPRRYIVQWGMQVPWLLERQIEQDLIISRALVELFNDPDIPQTLAFRGGTALYKLFIDKPVRYSEDIDLVQLKVAPIGSVLDAIRNRLDVWLGKPQIKRAQGRVTLVYRYVSEEADKIPMKLKIEINTQEHFTVQELQNKIFKVNSDWFSGTVEIPTYTLEELLGTKLRALYQRKKGRDLFDLWYVDQMLDCARNQVIMNFQYYIQQQNLTITRAQFEENLVEKLGSPLFLKDMDPLLVSSFIWDIHKAAEIVKSKFIALLPGDPWKGNNGTGK